jgi:hypothetical protein
MIKRIILNIISMFCLADTSTGAAESNVVTARYSKGDHFYGQETVDQILANGKVELDGTKVTRRLDINGKLTAKDAQIATMQVNGKTSLDHCSIESLQVHGKTSIDSCSVGAMEVYGKALLDNCSIKNKSSVTGSLDARSSTFADELTVAPEKVVFKSCSLSSLRIAEAKGSKRAQVVELKETTNVNGSITFERGNGEVILGSNCVISGNSLVGSCANRGGVYGSVVPVAHQRSSA